MPSFRYLVAAFAILAVILTAGAAGAARGQAMAAGEVVVCSGGAAVTLTVDAEGRPTGPAHWCPDCVLSLFAAAVPEAAPPVPPGAVRTVSAAPAEAPALRGRAVLPGARGPPARA